MWHLHYLESITILSPLQLLNMMICRCQKITQLNTATHSHVKYDDNIKITIYLGSFLTLDWTYVLFIFHNLYNTKSSLFLLSPLFVIESVQLGKMSTPQALISCFCCCFVVVVCAALCQAIKLVLENYHEIIMIIMRYLLF